MCGLVGIAGDTSYDWKDVFTDLLIVDSVRGMHSTGVAAVKRFQNQINLLKRPGPSHFLITEADYKPAIADPMKVIIGHNRFATIGEHSADNAHPFAFQNVVGAHNGTLFQSSIKKLHDHDKFGTDSQALYANIDQFGIQDTVDKLAGAWALTWFDVKENTINFLRNDKRPLFYTYSKDRCTLLWASEQPMLEFALARHNRLEKDHMFYTVDVDQHLSWKIPEYNGRKFDAPEKVERKAPLPPPVTYTYYGNGGGWREKDNNRGTSYAAYGSNQGGGSANVVPFKEGGKKSQQHTKTGGTNSTPTAFKDRRNTGKFRPPYKDVNGKILNKKLFNKLVSQGCVYCESPNSMWGEFIQPFKDEDGKQVFLCEECYENDEIFELCRHMI